MSRMSNLVEFALGSRTIGVDMVHFAWIGDLREDSDAAFVGVRTALRLRNVPWNRIVFWCESRNMALARRVLSVVSPKIWVMSMSELFDWWKTTDLEESPALVEAARYVYTSLKRLAAFSAAKDLASFCILRTVGGYFFDASVQFLDALEFFPKTGKQLPPNWRTDTNMPVRASHSWADDAWGLYSLPRSEATKLALNSYLLTATRIGLNYRRRVAPDFFKSVTAKAPYVPDPTRYQPLLRQENLGVANESMQMRQDRVGMIQDLVMCALSVGWGDGASFGQKYIEGERPLLTIPEFGLLKVPSSSTLEMDPSKWTGWKATPFRDWSTRL